MAEHTLSVVRGARAQDQNVATDLGWRIATILCVYRTLIALLLLLVDFVVRQPPVVGAHSRELFQATAVIYLLLGLVGLIASNRRQPELNVQTRWLLLMDIIVVSLLLHASGGVQSGLANLLIISVGASSLILPARMALLAASIAALAILFEQSASQFEGVTQGADFISAGLVGGGILLISLVAQPVAQRLRESEALARQRGVDLANLAELNNYIIQHLRESILVLDADDTVRLINDTAGRHLGMAANQLGRPVGDINPRLHELARSWREDAGETRASLASFLAADGTTLITPHFAPIGDARPAPTIVFLEDNSQLAERVQQTKLAALGRLSASIAHEIRNPVGAISHAGQLLGESERLGNEEKRLTDIIHTHCGRVNAIIKNVLQLSRREQIQPQQLQIDTWLVDFLTEFAASMEVANADFALEVQTPQTVVRMDASHLHQVMWNLCENAFRYAPPTDGGVRFVLRTGRLSATSRPFLEVLDRGPGIDPQFHEMLFEPFFTQAKDGTGLGLFIARELCEVNGARLVFEPRDGGGSCFRIIFADPERWKV